jgi:hypothetical protein
MNAPEPAVHHSLEPEREEDIENENPDFQFAAFRHLFKYFFALCDFGKRPESERENKFENRYER